MRYQPSLHLNILTGCLLMCALAWLPCQHSADPPAQ